MALQVRFILTRPDTSAEFWWNSTNSEILNYCNQIKALAQSLNIQHTYSESEDSLTANSIFSVASLQHWLDFNQRITDEFSNMFSKRVEYFSTNNHILAVEWFDSVKQQVVFRNNNILVSSASNDIDISTIY